MAIHLARDAAARFHTLEAIRIVSGQGNLKVITVDRWPPSMTG